VIIKLLLIGSVLVGCHWMLRGQRRPGRLAFRRIVGLLLAIGWIVAVLSPDSVTRLAHVVGVGRGTDLVLYATVVAFMFTTVLQYGRMQELEARLARLTRAQALLEHQILGDRPAEAEHRG
jgi:hypothetical protein